MANPAYNANSAVNPGFGMMKPLAASQTSAATGTTPKVATPPMPFINQINAFKNTFETAKAAGASQTSLDQISAAASNYRKQNGIRDDDQRFGTEAGVYTPPMPQEQPATNPDNPPPTAAATTTTPAATGTAPQYNMTPDQIQAEAAAQIARRRAAMSQSVDATKTGLKNTYDYQNQIIGDRRTLENGFFQRQNSPFSGKSDYLAADLARTRSISDTSMDKDYAAQVSAADRQLADFDTLAPEQQQAAYQALLRIERDYGLQAGALTGTFGGQQTLAARNSDRQFGLDEGALTGVYGGQQTAAQRNADRGFGLQEGSLTGSYGGERTLAGQQFDRGTFESDRNFNFQQAQQEWDNTFKQGTFDYQKASDLWERQFKDKSFDQSVKQFASSMGLDYSRLNQDQQQFVAQQAYQNKALGWDMSKDNPSNQPKSSGGSSTPSKIDSKTSTDNYDLIYDDLQTSGVTKDKARQLVETNKDFLSDSDYKKLKDYVNANF